MLFHFTWVCFFLTAKKRNSRGASARPSPPRETLNLIKQRKRTNVLSQRLRLRNKNLVRLLHFKRKRTPIVPIEKQIMIPIANPKFRKDLNTRERILRFFLTKSSPSAKRMEFLHFHSCHKATVHTAIKTFPHFFLWSNCRATLLNISTEVKEGDENPHHTQIFLHIMLAELHVKKQWSNDSAWLPQKIQAKDCTGIPLLERLIRMGRESFRKRHKKILILIGIKLLQILQGSPSPSLFCESSKRLDMCLTEKSPTFSHDHLQMSCPVSL